MEGKCCPLCRLVSSAEEIGAPSSCMDLVVVLLAAVQVALTWMRLISYDSGGKRNCIMAMCSSIFYNE